MSRFARYRTLSQLVEQESIEERDVQHAAELAKLSPSPQQWHSFLNQVLLWLGVLGLSFGGIFFVAANWPELGKIGRFALIECALVSVLLAYWRYQHKPEMKRSA